MEDLYKDNPNSWLTRAYFSKTVYRRPDPSQLPIIPLDELKLWHSEFNSNLGNTSKPVTWNNISKPVTGDNTSKTSQSTTISTLKSNPDSTLTSKVPEDSNSKTNKAEPPSKNKALSGMLKAVKDTISMKFAGPPSRERRGTKTVKSACGPKKYFDRGGCQMSGRETSSEVHGLVDKSKLFE